MAPKKSGKKDQDEKPTLSRRLTLLFYLCFDTRDSKMAQPVFDLNENHERISRAPRHLAALENLGIPQFWASEECPPKYDKEWGQHWATVRESFIAFVAAQVKRDEISNFDWSANPALVAVEKTFAARKWHAPWDPMLKAELEALELTPQQVWARSEDNTMPGTAFYDEHKRKILVPVFGEDSYVGGLRIRPALDRYWKSWLLGQRDAAMQRLSRGAKTLAKAKSLILDALGPSFASGDDSDLRTLTLAKIKAVMKLLARYRDALKYSKLTVEDEEQLVTRVAPDVDSVKAFREQLSPNVKEHDFCGVTTGWIHRLIEIRSGTEFAEPELPETYAEAFARGKVLADARSNAISHEMEEIHETQLGEYLDQVENFCQRWQTSKPSEQPETILNLLSGDNEVNASVFIEGEDQGVEQFLGWDREKVAAYLGVNLFRNQLPPLMRKHIAAEHTVYDDSADVPVFAIHDDGSVDTARPLTSEAQVFFHQLVGVASIMTRFMDSSRSLHAVLAPGQDASQAPRALREKWSQVPGVLLADDVGLGKTFQLIYWLTLVMWCQTIQVRHEEASPDSLPRILQCPLGGLDRIPNERHLIVCSPSLIGQWLSEIRRFTGSMIELHVFLPKRATWGDTVKQMIDSKTEKIHQIVLLPTTVLARMAREAVGVNVDGRPRVRFPLLAPQVYLQTVFDMSWTTLVYDEAHELRTQKTAWRAADMLCTLALFKVFATATPYVEGPGDVLALAKLIRAPSLSRLAADALGDKLALIRRSKAKLRADNLEAARFFGASGSIAPAGSDGVSVEASVVEANNALVEGIVKTLQKIMLPHAIRRTGISVNPDGSRVSSALPPLTAVHLCLPLTAAEVDRAALHDRPDTNVAKLDEARIAGDRASTRNARQHGDFYLEERSYLSFPPGLQSSGHVETMEGPATKLATLFLLIRQALTVGIDKIVPDGVHGKRDRYLELSQLGLKMPETNDDNHYDFEPLPKDPDLLPDTKVVVATLLAQHHPHFVQFLRSLGVNCRYINGTISPAQRARTLAEFKADPKIRVLIVSSVGITGLNIIEASVMILYDVNWSSVMSEQAYGRIHRQGQTKPTFAFQMVGQDTVEAFLAMLGNRKAQLANVFSTVERSKEFFESARRYWSVHAACGDDDEDVLEEDLGDAADEVNQRLHQLRVEQRKRKREHSPAPSAEDEDITDRNNSAPVNVAAKALPNVPAKAPAAKTPVSANAVPKLRKTERKATKKPKPVSKKLKKPAVTVDSDAEVAMLVDDVEHDELGEGGSTSQRPTKKGQKGKSSVTDVEMTNNSESEGDKSERRRSTRTNRRT